MEVVLNDLSLEGQFDTVEEFSESLLQYTLPTLEILKNNQIEVLKSYMMYNLMVTPTHKFADIMQLSGDPVLSKLRSQLHSLYGEEPYWEDDSQCNEDAIYSCKYTESFNGYCIAEALERNAWIYSFENEKFIDEFLEITKNGEVHRLINFFEPNMLIKSLLDLRIITMPQYLGLKYKSDKSFGIGINKDYFSELVEEASLSAEDIEIITEDIERLISLIKEGANLGRLSDTFDNGLREFRTSLDHRREIRIFYYLENNNPIFLNGFLKKTQKTPPSQIQKAERIRAQL